MNQSNSSKQVLLSVIGVAILVVAVVGVSFAFFNYTRTGSANTIKTGNIIFNSSQTNIEVENAFPMARSTVLGITSSTPTSGSGLNDSVTIATVTISGNTTYAAGLDFRVTAQEVTLGAGTQTLPISVLVSTNGNLGTVADADAPVATTASPTATDYGNITVASYEPTINTQTGLAEGVVGNGNVLASGHINVNQNVSQTITIKVFIDADKVAITDTPAGGNYDVQQSPETGYAANANGSNASNGTTSAWINGRYVLTTTNWNALGTTAASFKIRVEAIQTGGTYAYQDNGTAKSTIPLPSARS